MVSDAPESPTFPARTAAMALFTGTCRFSPPLDPRGGRVRRDGSTTDWWLILACDPELGRYLRHLYHLDARRIRQLSDPLGEETSNEEWTSTIPHERQRSGVELAVATVAKWPKAEIRGCDKRHCGKGRST